MKRKNPQKTSPSDSNCIYPKRIFRSQKHIAKMVSRLSTVNPKPVDCQAEVVRERKVSDGKTFDRLYEMSRQKEAKQEELQKQQEEAERIEFAKYTTKSCKRSLSLVADQFSRFLKTHFEGRDELPGDELVNFFRFLGLLDMRQDLSCNAMLEEESRGWAQENDLYNVCKLVESLENAMKSNSPTAFENFVNQRIMIAIANGLKFHPKVEEAPEPSPVRQMHRDTLTRLTKTRSGQVRAKPSGDVKRPKFVPRIDFDEELPAVPKSVVTQGILKRSELAHLSHSERQAKLSERRAAKVQELEQEAKRSFEPVKSHPMPELSSEMRDQLEARRERLRQQGSGSPTFRPSVLKYDDFLRIRKSMYQEGNHPEGWEASVTRMRLGHEQHLERKVAQLERNGLWMKDP
jgi:hypothetical protein